MDWSKAHPGRLITGDCNRNIHLFEPVGNANAPSWSINSSTPFSGHTDRGRFTMESTEKTVLHLVVWIEVSESGIQGNMTNRN